MQHYDLTIPAMVNPMENSLTVQYPNGLKIRWRYSVDTLMVRKYLLVHQWGDGSHYDWRKSFKNLENYKKLAGILLIAPAPDFTHLLMEPKFSSDQIKELEQNGFIIEPSEYSDEPNIITKALIEDGRNNLVLEGIINTRCPVFILQGMKDQDVPYEHAMRLINHLPSEDVTITLVNDGDHRLSREQDLELLKHALELLVKKSKL